TVGGGTLEIGDNEAVGSTAGGGAIELSGGSLMTGGDNTSTTFSGVISGAETLVKNGTGTMTLSGANTHGGSYVSAGTLNVTGSLTSSTTVAAGATLTGTGTLGELTVNGTLAPGASPGILHTGNLTFGSSGVFAA